MRRLRTTPFQRIMLTLPVVALVDLLLIIISIIKGRPTLWQILIVNLLILPTLALRHGLSFVWRLRCPHCKAAFGEDTGADKSGYPIYRCPKCGSEWLL